MDNQNQEQDLSQPQPTSLLRKLSSVATKHIIIFLAILATLSLGSTSYLLFANKGEKASLPPKPEEDSTVVPTLTFKEAILPPTATPTPTVKLDQDTDPTATWSAFTSSKYDYSLKYPPSWTAKITTQTDPKILEYVVFNEVSTKAGTLSITLSYGTRTYKDALALDPQIGESMIVASVGATKKNTKDSNGNKATNVIVPFGSNTIIFNAKDAFASLFNQMLTTLKLTK